MLINVYRISYYLVTDMAQRVFEAKMTKQLEEANNRGDVRAARAILAAMQTQLAEKNVVAGPFSVVLASSDQEKAIASIACGPQQFVEVRDIRKEMVDIPLIQ